MTNDLSASQILPPPPGPRKHQAAGAADRWLLMEGGAACERSHSLRRQECLHSAMRDRQECPPHRGEVRIDHPKPPWHTKSSPSCGTPIRQHILPPAHAELEPVENAGAPSISATDRDWSRERVSFLAWQPSRRLLRAIRRYQRWRHRLGPIGWLIACIAILQYHFWSIVTGADIPLNNVLGGGLLLPHPNGIVIHP